MLATPTHRAHTTDGDTAGSRHGPKVGAGRDRCGCLVLMQRCELTGNTGNRTLRSARVGNDFLGGDPLDHTFLDAAFSYLDQSAGRCICAGKMFIDGRLSGDTCGDNVWNGRERHMGFSVGWL
jgi:hypothetical protein